MTENEAVIAAKAVLHAHIDALNARDEAQLAATLHFPHFRLSCAALKVWESSEQYFEDFRARAGASWARSEFGDIQMLQASADKVHFDLRVDRFDRAGDLITSFRSLWVITREKGRWAAKFRSSFAAK